MGLLYLLVTLVNQVVRTGAAYLTEDVKWRATNWLRNDLARHCLSLDMAFHNEHTPGAMTERIDSGGNELSNFFSQFVIDSDGKLKYVNESVIAGGGIQPPNEGFDAQETMDAFLAAVRDEDSAAFAETLGPDGAYFEAEDPLAEFSSMWATRAGFFDGSSAKIDVLSDSPSTSERLSAPVAGW